MRRFDFYAKRQAGGTLTGLIVGLIIGLSIAVVVGLTIMKMPLPFVDRLGKQSEPAGELGDPNKTMPGGARERRERLADEDTGATSPAAGAAVKKLPELLPEPVVTIESVIKSRTTAMERTVPEKNPATPTPPPTPAPTLSPAPTTATPATATATANDEKFTYYLQAGAFREIADAENTKAKLALLGVAATVAERRSELGSLFRVRIGPFTEVEAMNRARSRLSDNGVDAAVVRAPK